MKVGINTLPLYTSHKSRGVGFYTKHLLEGLKNVPDVVVREFSDVNTLKDVDLVHYPYFDLFKHSLPFRKRFPTVVTIHDVTPLVFPTHFPPGLKGGCLHLLQRLSLYNARAVITDSNSSGDDIKKYLNVNADKIFPIYLAPADHFRKIDGTKLFTQTIREYSLPDNFALYVGDVNWNKNLLNLTQACVDVPLDLVLIGKSFETRSNLDHPELRDFKEFLAKFGSNSRVHILGYVEDSDLVKLMNLARLLLLPSFYEGFGLTILESQACGTPVVTSNVSSMTEVGGRGAIYVNPYKVDEISKAIEGIISDKVLVKKLVKAGLENVKRFSWKKTVAGTMEVYNSVLGARK